MKTLIQLFFQDQLTTANNEDTFFQDFLEEICSLYHMDSVVISSFKSSTTHGCITRRERIDAALVHYIKISVATTNSWTMYLFN